MKKIYSLFITSCIIIYIFLLFRNTEQVLLAAKNAIDIWKNNIFPSLFPFLIISHIMIDFGFIELFKEILKPLMSFFKLNPNSSFILAMSLISGSPSNAKYIKELYNKNLISKEEAEKTLTFTYFSSPLFIIGTVGILYLNNIKIAILILGVHIFSNLVVVFLFRNYHISKIPNKEINIKSAMINMLKIQKNTKISVSIIKSIQESLTTMILILGSVTFIFILTAALSSILPNHPYINATIKGILEVTQGLQAISLLEIPINYKGCLSIMILSFGGISIYIQIISILSDTDINTIPYLIARIFHSSISGILFYLIYPFFNIN